MKKYLIALILVLACTATTVEAVPKHRHHLQVTVTDTNDKQPQESIEAYSDTTSAADTGSKDTLYTVNSSASGSYNPADYDNPFDHFVHSSGRGAAEIIFVIGIAIFLLIIALAPFIVIIYLIRYLIKRHNDKVMLAQKAMETGRPIPEEVTQTTHRSPRYNREKGIKNIFLGLGLMALFYFLDAREIVGVGALVAFMGAGQWVISRNSSKNGNDNDQQF